MKLSRIIITALVFLIIATALVFTIANNVQTENSKKSIKRFAGITGMAPAPKPKPQTDAEKKATEEAKKKAAKDKAAAEAAKKKAEADAKKKAAEEAKQKAAAEAKKKVEAIIKGLGIPAHVPGKYRIRPDYSPSLMESNIVIEGDLIKTGAGISYVNINTKNKPESEVMGTIVKYISKTALKGIGINPDHYTYLSYETGSGLTLTRTGGDGPERIYVKVTNVGNEVRVDINTGVNTGTGASGVYDLEGKMYYGPSKIPSSTSPGKVIDLGGGFKISQGEANALSVLEAITIKIEINEKGGVTTEERDALIKFKDSWKKQGNVWVSNDGTTRIQIGQDFSALKRIYEGGVISSVVYLPVGGTTSVKIEDKKTLGILGLEREGPMPSGLTSTSNEAGVTTTTVTTGATTKTVRQYGKVYEETNERRERFIIGEDSSGKEVKIKVGQKAYDLSHVNFDPKFETPDKKPVIYIDGDYYTLDGVLYKGRKTSLSSGRGTGRTKDGVEYPSTDIGDGTAVPDAVLKKLLLLDENGVQNTESWQFKVDADGNTLALARDGTAASILDRNGNFIAQTREKRTVAAIRDDLDSIDLSQSIRDGEILKGFKYKSPKDGLYGVRVSSDGAIIEYLDDKGAVVQTASAFFETGERLIEKKGEGGKVSYSLRLKDGKEVVVSSYAAALLQVEGVRISYKNGVLSIVGISGDISVSRDSRGFEKILTPLGGDNVMLQIINPDNVPMGSLDIPRGLAERISTEGLKGDEKFVKTGDYYEFRRGDTPITSYKLWDNGVVETKDWANNRQKFERPDKSVIESIPGIENYMLILSDKTSTTVSETIKSMLVESYGKYKIERGVNGWFDLKEGETLRGGFAENIATKSFVFMDVLSQAWGVINGQSFVIPGIPIELFKEINPRELGNEIKKISRDGVKLVLYSEAGIDRTIFNEGGIIKTGSDFVVGPDGKPILDKPRVKTYTNRDNKGTAISKVIEHLDGNGEKLASKETVYLTEQDTEHGIHVYPSDRGITSYIDGTIKETRYVTQDFWTKGIADETTGYVADIDYATGIITIKRNKVALKGEELKDPKVLALQQKAVSNLKRESLGLAIGEAYDAALGASKFESAFGLSWSKQTGIFSEIHRFFTEDVLGSLIVGNWEESICRFSIKQARKEGVLIVDTPAGLVKTGAHIEGQRFDVEHPAECKSSDDCKAYSETSSCITNNCVQDGEIIKTTDHLYKITFEIENPETGDKSERGLQFNVYLQEESGNKAWFFVSETTKARKDIKLGETESSRKVGEAAFVKYSKKLYTKVCMVIDGDGANNLGVSPGFSLCKDFQIISQEAHPEPTDYMSPEEKKTGAAGGKEEGAVVNSDI